MILISSTFILFTSLTGISHCHAPLTSHNQYKWVHSYWYTCLAGVYSTFTFLPMCTFTVFLLFLVHLVSGVGSYQNYTLWCCPRGCTVLGIKMSLHSELHAFALRGGAILITLTPNNASIWKYLFKLIRLHSLYCDIVAIKLTGTQHQIQLYIHSSSEV